MHYVTLEYLLWMIGTFSLYWLSPAAWRQVVLVLLTVALLVHESPLSAGLLVLFTALTAALVRQPRPHGGQVAGMSALMVSVLIYFKLGATGQSVENIVTDALIPLGLSYYTFRCLHLMFERYRGRFGDATTWEVIGYLFFLPTLLVGPIHRFGAYQRDLYRVRLDRAMLSQGLERILYGYVKIGFLANHLVNGTLGIYVDQLPPEQAALQAYLWIVQGGLNLYFQFSGFADISIGFSRLLGFEVMENFNWPFLRRNLSEYWRCWHMSLTSWCRDYIYTSVVSFSRSPALGAIATLLVIGLWHELSLRFVCWGLYHGFGLVVWQAFQDVKAHLPEVRTGWMRHLLTGLSIIFTVHYVWFGFAIVRKDSLSEVWTVWKTATLGFLM
ncbi:D-alanyl-lipoteichoic acid biosynthesis protein DltB [Magnetospira thiophila]